MPTKPVSPTGTPTPDVGIGDALIGSWSAPSVGWGIAFNEDGTWRTYEPNATLDGGEYTLEGSRLTVTRTSGENPEFEGTTGTYVVTVNSDGTLGFELVQDPCKLCAIVLEGNAWESVDPGEVL